MIKIRRWKKNENKEIKVIKAADLIIINRLICPGNGMFEVEI